MCRKLHSIALALVAIVGWYTSHAANLILPDKADASVRLALDREPADFNLRGYLQLYVGQPAACCSNKTPMAGRYRVEDRTVIFEPAFSFIEDQTYTVAVKYEIYGGNDKNKTEHYAGNSASNHDARALYDFVIPSAGRAIKPAVVSIFPSGDEIPENTLRFYLHFSTPMKPHVSADFIKLQDHNGAEVSAAFMAFKQELWSEDRRRLTVLMDPGRIKRGVAQNRTVGPALTEGRYYSIAIDEGWPSANGDHVAAAFEKRFLVTRALRELPGINDWQITTPRVSTREPLTLMFDRAFDAAQLQSAIKVVDADGQVIAGTITTENREHTWLFSPQAPWADEIIHLAVARQLEDVAGNNLIELLDYPAESSADTTGHPFENKVITVALKPASG